MELRKYPTEPSAKGPTQQEMDLTAIDNHIERSTGSLEQHASPEPSTTPCTEQVSIRSAPSHCTDDNATQDTGDDSSDSDKVLQNQPQTAYAWTPGFWQRLPWSSAVALIVAILCGGASTVVLRVSDKQAVESWSLRPSVWLAIFSALANTSLRFALSEGVGIAWWHHVSKPGTLGDLHQYWTCGVSLKAACGSVHRLNVVAVASIMVATVVIDGPLLQRASSTKLSQVSSTLSLNMTLATALPYGYTGMDYAGDNVPKNDRAILTPWFLQKFLAYNQRSPILANADLGCKGICVGEVEAAGLWGDCTETSETFSWPKDYSYQDAGNVSSRRVFGVDWELMTKYPAMNFLDYGFTPVKDEKDDVIAPDEAYIRLNMTYSPFPTIGSDG